MEDKQFCDHPQISFHSGDYHIQCDICGATWDIQDRDKFTPNFPLKTRLGRVRTFQVPDDGK